MATLKDVQDLNIEWRRIKNERGPLPSEEDLRCDDRFKNRFNRMRREMKGKDPSSKLTAHAEFLYELAVKELSGIKFGKPIGP